MSNCLCGQPRTGLVTSSPPGGIEACTRAPVCGLPACVEEASAWVRRVSFGKPAFHTLDLQTGGGVSSEVDTPPSNDGGAAAPPTVPVAAGMVAESATPTAAPSSPVTGEVVS